MKRSIALMLSVILTGSLFAGCGAKSTATAQATPGQDTKSTAPSEKKLSGKIIVDTSYSNFIDTTLKDLAKQFMDQNPGTKIEYAAVPDADKTLKIKMASNSLDDITMVMNDTKAADFPKYFTPIDGLGFTKDNLYFYNNGLGTDSKLYKMTEGITYSGMVYNKKVFADCGITKIPTTWDELYAACEKIKAKGITPVASNFKDKWPLQFWVNADFVFSNTGNVNYLNDYAGKNEILSDDKGALAGLKALKALKDKGYLENDLMSTNWDGFCKDFPQGKFAMAYLGSWYPAQFVQKGGKIEDVGMFPIPGVKSLQVSPDWYYAISTSSQNAELAKAYIKWAFNESRYSNAVGVATSTKGGKVSDPSIAELCSSKLPVIETAALKEDYTTILSKAQIDYMNMIQDYLISKNPDEVVTKYNKMWADAKKAVGK